MFQDHEGTNLRDSSLKEKEKNGKIRRTEERVGTYCRNERCRRRWW